MVRLSARSDSEKDKKWYEGIAGLGPKCSLFSFVPDWVDENLPPGATSQTESLTNNPEWFRLITGQGLIFSPNLVWLVMTIIVYVVFPYDYEVSKQWDTTYGKWIVQRAILNLSLVYSYYGFWHAMLYWFGRSHRPFQPNRQYRWSKVLHNVWYATLGTLQWTCWESVMLNCWATGRMPYLSDKEALASPFYGVIHFTFWAVVTPLFREIHFYFCHRLIHFRSLYTYIHSVHHRNTDVEPFSGISMHPIEHLYYFTSIAPSLYFCVTPFAFLWNGVHLIISPGNAHSGFEDHWQSGQMHYLHHRYFECNYGTESFFLDNVFGTYRDKLSTKSSTYRGAANGIGDKTSEALDSRATLIGWPEWDQLIFNVLFCLLIPMKYIMALVYFDENSNPFLMSLLLVIGPVIGSIVLMFVKSSLKARERGKSESIKVQLSYPFHKEVISQLGLHLLVGFTLGVIPAFHLFNMAISEPGQGAYIMIWQQNLRS